MRKSHTLKDLNVLTGILRGAIGLAVYHKFMALSMHPSLTYRNRDRVW